MTLNVKPIPDGYHNVSPYLVVNGAPRLLEFVRKTFDATVRCHIEAPGGTIGHAEVVIGDSSVMMGDACGEYPAMPAMLYVYVLDVDATYRRALDAGATSLKEPANQFYGDRNATVKDPVGNVWCIATHVEDVSEEELQRRAQEVMAQERK